MPVAAAGLTLLGAWKLWGTPTPEDLGWSRPFSAHEDEEITNKDGRQENAQEAVYDEVKDGEGLDEEGAEEKKESLLIELPDGSYRYPVRHYGPPRRDGPRWTT